MTKLLGGQLDCLVLVVCRVNKLAGMLVWNSIEINLSANDCGIRYCFALEILAHLLECEVTARWSMRPPVAIIRLSERSLLSAGQPR